MNTTPSSARKALPHATILAAALLSSCHANTAAPGAGSGGVGALRTAASGAVVGIPATSSAAPPALLLPAGSPFDFSAMNAALAGKKPAPSCAPVGRGVRYDIGSARTPTFNDVPWTSLGPGDVVCVPYRSEPYRAKIYFVTRGAAGAPIRLVGLRGPRGERPILDGDGATTSKLITPAEDETRLEPLGVISMITKFVTPRGSAWGWHPGWITVTGLKVQHARPASTFTNSAGKSQRYAGFSAGFYLNPADDVVIEDCEITDSQLGVFAKTFERVNGQQDRATERLTLRGNYIHDNGDTKSMGIHNVYIEGRGCNVLGNSMVHKAGNVGVNYKSRCGHERIFANRIEGGAQGLLSLINPESGWDVLGTVADYEPTVVAGNLLINPHDNGAVGSPLVGFGGDSYTDADRYRKRLIFYANTVLGRSHGGARIPVIGTPHFTKEQPRITTWLSSNLIDNAGDDAQAGPLHLSLATGLGRVVLDHSFLDPSVPEYDEYEKERGTITGFAPTPAGTAPGIPGGRAEPRPVKGSPLIDAGATFASLPKESLASTVMDFALYEPTGTLSDPWYRARVVKGAVDIGAYEADP